MSITPREPSKAAAQRLGRLFEILQYRRPHGSKSEAKCINQFIRRIKGVKEYQGGLVVEVLPKVSPGALQWRSDTLFSCHTDTVHHDGGTQDIELDEELGLVYKTDNDPLGADDGAGMWLMLEMIDAGVPGTYVFHRAEERGGLGSSWFTREMPDFLKRFKRAIAFDRRDTSHVITWQRGGWCCSDKFAKALAEALNAQHPDFTYKPDSTGVFTDTGNYTHLIPECTNLSVGYEHEHSKHETLDILHLVRLREALLKIEWEKLPTEREPKEHYTYSWPDINSKFKSKSTPDVGAGKAPTVTEATLMDLGELEVWAMDYPDEVAAMLYDLLHHDGEQEVAETSDPKTGADRFIDDADVIELAGERYMDDGSGNLVKIRGELPALLGTPPQRDSVEDEDLYGYPREY